MGAPKTRGRGYKHLREKDFDQVKLLQGAGLTISQVCGLTKRSHSTVSLLYRAKSWQDYKAIKQEMYLHQPSYLKRLEERNKKKNEKRQEAFSSPITHDDELPGQFPVPGTANPVNTEDTTIKEILNDINYNLKGINKRLKKIEHNQSRKKMGIF